MIVALPFCSNRWSSLCLLPASRQSQHKYAASCWVIWRDVCHWSARGGGELLLYMRQFSGICTTRYWQAKNQNLSENWQNWFNTVVEKPHSDLFSVLTEFQKDQAHSERMITELSVGKRCATKVAVRPKMITKSRGDVQWTRGR